jgi:hypothetical protein
MTQPASLAQVLIVSPALQGPPGLSAIATTQTAFTQPDAGGTTGSIGVDIVAALGVGAYVDVFSPSTFFGNYQIATVDPSTVPPTVTLAFNAGGGGVPTGTTIPSGSTLVPASAAANGILGTSLVGTSSLIEDASDWSTVAAGQIATVYTMPGGSTGFGEQITLAVTIDIQSAAPVLTVSGASNATPIQLTLSGIVGVVNGSLVGTTGIGGNAAANGGFIAQAVDPTHINLLNPPAPGTNTTGSGSYTSGGILVPHDFGTFTRRGEFRNIFGVLVNATGGTSDTDVTLPSPPNNVSASLQNTLSVTIVAQSETLMVRVDNTANAFPVRCAVSGSIARRPVPGAGPVPVVSTVNGSSSASGLASGTVGPFVIVGENFTGAQTVTFAGVGQSFVVNSSTQITVASLTSPTPGSSAALGITGDIDVTTVNGTGVLINGFTYIPTIPSIFGTSLAGFWLNTNIAQSSGHVTSWPDATTNANNLPLGSGANPTYLATDGGITPPGPCVSFDGGADYFTLTPTVGIAANSPLYMSGIIQIAAGGSIGEVVMSYHSSAIQELGVGATLGEPRMLGNAGQGPTWGSSVAGTTVQITGYNDGTAGAGNVATVNIDNSGSPVSASGTAGFGTAANARLDVGFRFGGGANFFKGKIYALILVTTAPSTAQKTAERSVWQRLYGVGV